jgi:acetyltransferase-like isoleucine patch superfamily enzyme
VEAGVRIGNSVTVKNGNFIWAGVTIRDGAFVGPQVVFTNDLHPRSPRLAQASPRYSSDEWLAPTLVEEGASIGGGAVILAGVTLNKFCMVAAGAVVTKSVQAHALVMGVPARAAGWVCSCGTRLKFEGDAKISSCEQCFREFELVDGELLQQGAGIQAL